MGRFDAADSVKQDAKAFSELSPYRRMLVELLMKEERSDEIPLRPHRDRFPLSAAQRALLEITASSSHSSFFNKYHGIMMYGNLDVDALDEAVSRFLSRHETMRYRIRKEGGDYFVDRLADTPKQPLERKDLKGDERELERLSLAIKTEPYDIDGGGQLYRLVLAKLSPTKHCFILGVHHSVFDGQSSQIWFSELKETYAALESGTDIQIAPPPFQFADYAAWRDLRASGPRDVIDRKFWEERLRGCTPPRLPVLRKKGTTAGERPGKYHDWKADDSVLEKVRGLARDCAASSFMTVFSAYLIWMRHWNPHPDDLVWSTCTNANRMRPGTDKIVGNFAYPIPIRAKIPSSTSFVEVIDQVKGILLESWPHADHEIEMPPELRAFNMNYVHAEPEEYFTWGKIRLEHYNPQILSTIFDLVFFMEEHESLLEARVLYDSTHLLAADVAEVVDDFERWLRALLDAPRTPLSELAVAQGTGPRR